MAEENQNKSYETNSEVEIKDRGVFDFFGKKNEEEKPQEPVPKVEHGEEKKHSLLEKLHRSDSSSSSSSDEEEIGEDGEKKKKKKEKKGLKEKIDEKIGSHDDEKAKKKYEDTAVPVEKVEVDPEHHKCFVDKIKEKLPGQHKKTEEVAVPPTSSTEYGGAHTKTSADVAHEGEAKEKKGLLEKIKEKLPGYHPKTGEEKEKEKESGAY